MKIVLILLLTVSMYASDLKDRIEKLIVPLKAEQIVHVRYDPFQRVQKVIQKVLIQKPQESSFHISSVLNGRVFVNSRWHSVGDTVNGYKIIQIREDSVLAKKSGKVLKFGIKRRNNIIKIEGK